MEGNLSLESSTLEQASNGRVPVRMTNMSFEGIGSKHMSVALNSLQINNYPEHRPKDFEKHAKFSDDEVIEKNYAIKNGKESTKELSVTIVNTSPVSSRR